MKSYTWRHAIINSDLQSVTRLVLLVLSCHINDAGESAYPSVKTLARECDASETTIVKHLRMAKLAGWLIVRKHGYAGQKWSRNEYYPRIPDDFELPAAPEKGAQLGEVPFGEKLSTEALNEMKRLSKKGTSRNEAPSAKALHLTTEGTSPDDVKALQQVKSNYSYELPVNYPPPARGDGEEKTGDEKIGTPLAFDRFWSAFPSHAGRKSNRDACEKEWARQNLDLDVELLVIHVEAMKLLKKWRDGYHPAPIRYLTERWWKDGMPEPKPVLQEEIQTGDWWDTDSGIAKRGGALNVQREKDEPTPKYLLRVAKAAGRGPHIDFVLQHAKRSGSAQWFQQVVQYLGEALMPTDFYAS